MTDPKPQYRMPTVPLPVVQGGPPTQAMMDVYARFQERTALESSAAYYKIIEAMPKNLHYEVADHLSGRPPL